MVGDVLAESVQIEDFVNLSRSVGLGGIGLLGLLRARLARHDCDTVINHNQPPPDLPQGGRVLYSAERIAGVKVLVIRLILSSVTIAFVTFDICICLV